MFLLIPLLCIAASFAGISIIVWRKVQYVQKLTPETGVASAGLVHEFFPELMEWFGDFNLTQYKQLSLKEVEKILRRLRVVSLRIDHVSDRLIKKIRKVHVASDLGKPVELPKVEIKEELIKEVVQEPVVVAPVVEEEPVWKKEEQKLIVAIAQSPKDPQLYETLGDLYLSINNTHDAQESFEAALELNPHNATLARKYSRLLNTTSVIE
ncbi:hypothetical protein KW791_02995 [Candidatus Parcubacteria bacterium]|nr:hypothetical protein [Candidatus Parcubacteria bacterium]